MIRFHIARELAGAGLAAGSHTGERHAKLILDQIKRGGVSESGFIVVVDFSGIELATASYVKATVLWLALCGRLYAGALSAVEQRSLHGSSVEPLNVFPVVFGANEDVQHEIDEVFARRNLPCLVANSMIGDLIRVGRVLGEIEPAAARTIAALAGFSEATAEDLHEKWPGEGVNITAWNNRLSGLHRIRVARRRKQGKTWKYQPLAKIMKYG